MIFDDGTSHSVLLTKSWHITKKWIGLQFRLNSEAGRPSGVRTPSDAAQKSENNYRKCLREESAKMDIPMNAPKPRPQNSSVE